MFGFFVQSYCVCFGGVAIRFMEELIKKSRGSFL